MMSILSFLVFVNLVVSTLAFFEQPISPFNNRPTRLYSSPNNDPNLKSVGDYVKQVHGGKYQFNDAGINSIGQEFAETGYASSSKEEDTEATLLAEIPRWANRMGTETDLESRIKGTIDLQSGPVSVDIVNNELTWEPFYVKVMTTTASSRDFTDTRPLSVHPRAGTLAPRGGAVNLCNPQKPYSDSATIRVESSGELSDRKPLFLLIGTEEEKWYYRIQLS